jgi:drug/metabolite transporter (DMT)-like permease
MVGSMALFSLEDFFIKLLSQTIPASEIMLIMGVLGSIFFITMAKAAKQPIFSRDLLDRHVIIRTLGDLFGALFFVSAIVLTPLSSASAILQGTPLAVTAGAAIFLGENVGIRRWFAVAIGLLGIILIIKPGVSDFSPFSLLAVAAVICL